jgi:hypothetical protein
MASRTPSIMARMLKVEPSRPISRTYLQARQAKQWRQAQQKAADCRKRVMRCRGKSAQLFVAVSGQRKAAVGNENLQHHKPCTLTH